MTKAETFAERCRRLLTEQPKQLEFTLSRAGLETLLIDCERHDHEASKVMIGGFIARWEDAADGVVMDADTAQALAREYKRLIAQDLKHSATIKVGSQIG